MTSLPAGRSPTIANSVKSCLGSDDKVIRFCLDVAEENARQAQGEPVQPKTIAEIAACLASAARRDTWPAMETHPRSLKHLVRYPQAGSGAPPLLLLLHGVGSNEHDLFSMAPYLDARFLIVSARAPITLMPGSYAWFEIAFTPNGILIDPQQAEASRQRLLQFIPEVVAAYHADPARVYLLGFSQGAIMSASVVLTRPDLIAGAVLMSGRLPREVLAHKASDDHLAGMPILVVHGVADDVLPIQFGRELRDFFTSLPVELTYHEYPMGHQVSAESLADVAAWLSARLDDQRAPKGER